MSTPQVGLAYEVAADGTAVVTVSGELDIASADGVYSYVRDIIDRHHVPVVVDLTSLAFCDARGLGALVRMNNYAAQADCALLLASPGRQLLKIIRITGLDRSLAIGVPLAVTALAGQPGVPAKTAVS